MPRYGIVRRFGVGGGLMGLFIAAACGGSKEVETEAVSQDGTVNAAVCYGENTKCQALEKELPPHCLGEAEKCPLLPHGRTLAQPQPAACPRAPGGPLVAESMDVALPGLLQMAAAGDGTLWALGKTEDSRGIAFWVEHLDARGNSLGRNEAAARRENVTEPVAHLAATPDGGAVVYAHFMDSPRNADSPLIQNVSVIRLDASAAVVDDPIALTSLSGGQVAVSPEGITVAATAAGVDQRGSLVRLSTEGTPLFIQNAVPSTGRGLGSGVGGLVMDAEGRTSVLTEQFRDFRRDESRFGIAHFDARGNLLENWLLPTPMSGGYRAKMVATDGIFAFRGTLNTDEDLVQTFDANGEARAAWSFSYSGEPDITTDPDTRAVLAWDGLALAVIDPDGTSCSRYTVSQLMAPSMPMIVASGGFLYQLVDDTLVRLPVP